MPLTKNHTAVVEYMKLRKYFVSMAAKGNMNEPLPSERELAELFGVTRNTVRRSLAQMEAERFVIRRPRRGYFPNPQARFSDIKVQKNIGLLIRDGLAAFYGMEEQRLLTSFCYGAVKAGYYIELLESTSPTTLFGELTHGMLDGLIWFGVDSKPGYSEVFERLVRESSLPIVGLFNWQKPSCGNYIFMEQQREIRLKIKYLAERGCRRIAVNAVEVTLGAESALHDCGLELIPELVIEADSFPEQLPKLIEVGHADGFAARLDQSVFLRRYAAGHGLRIPEDLQIVGGFRTSANPVTTTRKPYVKIVSAMMKQLAAMFAGKKTILQKSDFDWTMINGNTTK